MSFLDGYKTKIGAFFLALESVLLQVPDTDPTFKLIVGFLGTFLTVYGFRDAMNKKK